MRQLSCDGDFRLWLQADSDWAENYFSFTFRSRHQPVRRSPAPELLHHGRAILQNAPPCRCGGPTAPLAAWRRKGGPVAQMSHRERRQAGIGAVAWQSGGWRLTAFCPLYRITRAISQEVGAAPAFQASLGWRSGSSYKVCEALPWPCSARGLLCSPLVLRRSTRYVTVRPQHASRNPGRCCI